MNSYHNIQGTIEINGLKLFGRHGVSEQETAVGNMFEVNASLQYPGHFAMRTDRIDLALNYAEVIAVLKQEMDIPSKLLENVVYRMYLSLIKRFPEITSGSLSVYKLNPPLSAEIDKIGFTFSW